MDTRPIGVFDSGLGGLTAVRELRQLLPSENIIYFGDTARVPYGGRSAEILLKFKTSGFSVKNCCHTPSASTSSCSSLI